VRRVIRVGTCGALGASLGHGDLIVAGEALAEDGASRSLGASEVAEPDAELTRRLAGVLPGSTGPVRIVTTDLFYGVDDDDAGPPRPRADAWLERGAVAVEMEAAALFTLGGRLGVASACLLAISDTFENGQRQRAGDEELAHAAARMAAAAPAALES
jgi:uridine phosphorylase